MKESLKDMAETILYAGHVGIGCGLVFGIPIFVVVLIYKWAVS